MGCRSIDSMAETRTMSLLEGKGEDKVNDLHLHHTKGLSGQVPQNCGILVDHTCRRLRLLRLHSSHHFLPRGVKPRLKLQPQHPETSCINVFPFRPSFSCERVVEALPLHAGTLFEDWILELGVWISCIRVPSGDG